MASYPGYAGPMGNRSPIFGTPQAPQNMFGLSSQAIADRKKKQQLQGVADTLTQLGIGLMGQGTSTTPQSPLQGLAQGLQGANQMQSQRQDQNMQQDRMDMAQAGFGMQQQEFQQGQQRQAEQDAFAKARTAQMEKLIAGLPQDQQDAARADQDTFFKAYAEAKFPKQGNEPNSVQEYKFAVSQGYKGTFQDWSAEKAKMSQQDASLRFGLNPVYGTDEQGNTVMMLPNTQGGVKVVPAPPGVKISPQTQFLDTGTGYVPMDKHNPQAPVAPTIAKDIAGEASAKTQGTAQGEAASALPSYANSAQMALSNVDQLLSDDMKEGREWATGKSSIYGAMVPGTSGYDFKANLDKLRGGVFLQAFQQLRGGGAITEVEGKKAEQAIAAMDAAQSEAQFRTALGEYRKVIEKGLSVAKQKATATPVMPGGAPPAAGTADDPLGLKVAP